MHIYTPYSLGRPIASSLCAQESPPKKSTFDMSLCLCSRLRCLQKTFGHLAFHFFVVNFHQFSQVGSPLRRSNAIHAANPAGFPRPRAEQKSTEPGSAPGRSKLRSPSGDESQCRWLHHSVVWAKRTSRKRSQLASDDARLTSKQFHPTSTVCVESSAASG